jgi:hypothetical protein
MPRGWPRLVIFSRKKGRLANGRVMDVSSMMEAVWD